MNAKRDSRSDPASPSRVVAHQAILQAFNPLAPGVAQIIEKADLSPSDRGLAREIAFGVVRRKIWLESVLARYVPKPLPDQALAAHTALLMGIYQHAFLDRLPIHAIVDETVKLVKAAPECANYVALTNAVMRRVTREKAEDLTPSPEENWRVRASVPKWLARVTTQAYGKDSAEACLLAMRERAPLTFRLRTPDAEAQLIAELTELGHTPRHGWLPGCVHVDDSSLAPDTLSCFQQGLVTVEDEGAQFAGALTGTGQRILDLCASPGGKTASIADHNPEAAITATDVSEPKLDRLRHTLERLNLSHRVRVDIAAKVIEQSPDGAFDLIVVDAPCSGLGTIRRRPEIALRRRPADIKRIADEQLAILNSITRLLAPGGSLVYSVCSYTQPEGPEVAERFLANNHHFIPDSAPPEMEFAPTSHQIAPGQWRTHPADDACDGFTICRFRKAHPAF